MNARQWSLAIVLILINYLIFATLFSRLLESDFNLNYATRTPIPTFTPAPAQPFIVVPTLTPPTPIPTPTATRVLSAPAVEDGAAPGENSSDSTASVPSSNQPSLVAPGAVNIRSGPGVNYGVIGTLNAGTAVSIVGRNADASWWQIEITTGIIGWVSDAVVSASNTGGVPVVETPPPPQPTTAEAQPAASNPSPKPQYQFEPTGWWDDGNQGLTRFYGNITDVNGNPVDGVFVRATCGDYATISYPSGPVGWGGYNESYDWPPGFYDITVDTKPVPCIWVLSIVETEDRKTVTAVLSEAIPVEVTMDKSIIVASWRKNW
ncbi:MAG: SH3 domain-containing protein [Anaerolineae bacterium]|nr:SH3 domain-containing protein [Anaerolineae bacterium]